MAEKIIIHKGMLLSYEDIANINAFGLEEKYYAETDELNVINMTGKLLEKENFKKSDVRSETSLVKIR